MSVMDGPSYNVWSVLAVGAWIVSAVFICYDAATYDGDGMGPLTPFGGMIALAAVVLTVAGIVRAAKDEVLGHMHEVFKMGRESVTGIQRR